MLDEILDFIEEIELAERINGVVRGGLSLVEQAGRKLSVEDEQPEKFLGEEPANKRGRSPGLYHAAAARIGGAISCRSHLEIEHQLDR